MAGSARVGSGHRAGGADLASGVDTAGTVARIDLRLLHHPDCEVASADSDASARINLWLVPVRPPRLHVSRPAPPALFTPPPLDRHRPLRSFELPTARAASGRVRCNGPPAWE